jgi:hypothetical protein
MAAMNFCIGTELAPNLEIAYTKADRGACSTAYSWNVLYDCRRNCHLSPFLCRPSNVSLFCRSYIEESGLAMKHLLPMLFSSLEHVL